MTRFFPGQWMTFTVPHGRPAVGKQEPPPQRKDRQATKPKRRKRRKRGTR